ncbi:uncharacterized protein FIESC28_11637 [Fusarium coffeatum]|uniref:Uncharacterized protein n=1 Tax=Fusarium coffeatum TaxID=231269 RepID=A0A366QGP1_9HYPO|nr:uncharacterized protein FIESC28_11637 [Fusarium coffeatum]RBR04099.1 hypothetical protein FIESC28_11637 [Fusarium coffeatum]
MDHQPPDTPSTSTNLIDVPARKITERPDILNLLTLSELTDILKKIDDESPTVSFPTMELMKTFNRLPPEMRLEIWEAIAPSGRDAIMGPYDVPEVSDEDDNYNDLDHGQLTSVLHTRDPLVMRQVSREALNVWTKASIGQLFMPLHEDALEHLQDLIFGVESIATLWPLSWQLKKLFDALLIRHERGCKPVKTVYVGVSVVVCEPYVSPIANSQLGEYKFRVFALDDEKLPTFIDNCNARRRYHNSKECYLTHLQEYWSKHKDPQELRDVWNKCISENENKISPELIPVVVGTESAHEIVYRTSSLFRSDVKQQKLAYSVQTYGWSKEWFEPGGPRHSFPLLRRARCSKCWPADATYYTLLDAEVPARDVLDFFAHTG